MHLSCFRQFRTVDLLWGLRRRNCKEVIRLSWQRWGRTGWPWALLHKLSALTNQLFLKLCHRMGRRWSMLRKSSGLIERLCLRLWTRLALHWVSPQQCCSVTLRCTCQPVQWWGLQVGEWMCGLAYLLLGSGSTRSFGCGNLRSKLNNSVRRKELARPPWNAKGNLKDIVLEFVWIASGIYPPIWGLNRTKECYGLETNVDP